MRHATLATLDRKGIRHVKINCKALFFASDSRSPSGGLGYPEDRRLSDHGGSHIDGH